MADYYTIEILTYNENEHPISELLNIELDTPYSFENPYRETPPFDCRFNIFIEDQDEAKKTTTTVNQLLSHTGFEYKIRWSENMNIDWQNEWKKFFKPIQIKEKLIVLPAWEQPGEHGEATTSQLRIYIDPGMAFGTGAHATTKGCLSLMVDLNFSGKNVLDFGTGSGILAIAAAQLGAAHIDAIDNDPIAVDSARNNAIVNGCDESIAFHINDRINAISPCPYHIIIANITTDVIMEHLDSLVINQPNLRTLILSGIIEHRKDELLTFLAVRQLSPTFTVTEGEWNTFLIQKN